MEKGVAVRPVDKKTGGNDGDSRSIGAPMELV